MTKPTRLRVGPVALGFIGSWLIFSASNTKEARFRYLGQQKLGALDSFVIAFAQTPGLVSNTIATKVGGVTVPLLFEGVAWIDQGDFRILQLRTDMLKARRDMGFQRVASTILFGSVELC